MNILAVYCIRGANKLIVYVGYQLVVCERSVAVKLYTNIEPFAYDGTRVNFLTVRVAVCIVRVVNPRAVGCAVEGKKHEGRCRRKRVLVTVVEGELRLRPSCNIRVSYVSLKYYNISKRIFLGCLNVDVRAGGGLCFRKAKNVILCISAYGVLLYRFFISCNGEFISADILVEGVNARRNDVLTFAVLDNRVKLHKNLKSSHPVGLSVHINSVPCKTESRENLTDKARRAYAGCVYVGLVFTRCDGHIRVSSRSLCIIMREASVVFLIALNFLIGLENSLSGILLKGRVNYIFNLCLYLLVIDITEVRNEACYGNPDVIYLAYIVCRGLFAYKALHKRPCRGCCVLLGIRHSEAVVKSHGFHKAVGIVILGSRMFSIRDIAPEACLGVDNLIKLAYEYLGKGHSVEFLISFAIAFNVDVRAEVFSGFFYLALGFTDAATA